MAFDLATIFDMDTSPFFPEHGQVSQQELPGSDQRPEEVQSLNRCLETLAAAFPQYRPYVFRNMLQNLSEESRLAIVADRILTNPNRWAPTESLRSMEPQDLDAEILQEYRTKRSSYEDPPLLEEQDMFRSPSYKGEVMRALEKEFAGIMRFQIEAVLKEENYSYFESRVRLYRLGGQSWLSSVMKLFHRKYRYADPRDLQNHPLIDWKVPEAPSIKWTRSGELNDELWQKLIAPHTASVKQAQVKADQELAYKVTYSLAEQDGELYECECCFGSEPIEYMVCCDSGQHFLCLSCVKRTASEALYGQNWAKSIDPTQCTIRCVAISTNGECNSIIPVRQFESALHRQEDGGAILEQIHSRIMSDGLQSSGTAVVQCPFCSYLETDEERYHYSLHSSLFQEPLNETGIRLRVKNINSLVAISVVLTYILYAHFRLSLELALFHVPVQCFLVAYFLRSLSVLCLVPKKPSSPWGRLHFLSAVWPFSRIVTSFQLALKLNHNIHPRKFKCQNPRCGATTCQNCKDVWRDIHRCRLQPVDTLKSRIEAAATKAITRTCGNCGLPFVKADGCNKIYCRCGTATCYVCNADITEVGYNHFCPHFRYEAGAPCREGPGGRPCDRCDLYQIDDDSRKRKAVERAVADWGVEMAQRERNRALTGQIDSRELRRQRIHLHRSTQFLMFGMAEENRKQEKQLRERERRAARERGEDVGEGVRRVRRYRVRRGNLNVRPEFMEAERRRHRAQVPTNLPLWMYVALCGRNAVTYLAYLSLDLFDIVRSMDLIADWVVDYFLE